MAEAIDSTMLIPDVRYFARHDRRLLPLLRATARHCSSCVSRVHRCSRRTSDRDTAQHGGRTEDGEETLWLEHVSMVSVLDSSLKIDVPHNHFVVNLRYRADTFQVQTHRSSLNLSLKPNKTLDKILVSSLSYVASVVTCYMRSHGVTCYPIQVNASRLNPSQ